MGFDAIDQIEKTLKNDNFIPHGKSSFGEAYATGIGMITQLNNEYLQQFDVKKKRSQQNKSQAIKQPEYLHIVIASDTANDKKQYEDLLKLQYQMKNKFSKGSRLFSQQKEQESAFLLQDQDGFYHQTAFIPFHDDKESKILRDECGKLLMHLGEHCNIKGCNKNKIEKHLNSKIDTFLEQNYQEELYQYKVILFTICCSSRMSDENVWTELADILHTQINDLKGF